MGETRENEARAKQGGRKDRRGNEPSGSCATCDARSTGVESGQEQNKTWRVKTKLSNRYKSTLLRMNGKPFFIAVL